MFCEGKKVRGGGGEGRNKNKYLNVMRHMWSVVREVSVLFFPVGVHWWHCLACDSRSVYVQRGQVNKCRDRQDIAGCAEW